MLTRKDDTEGTWYPVAIKQLECLIQKVIYPGRGYRNLYALRKNLAYNLQYIEFLHLCLEDLKISSVIKTQIWKNFIMVGCGIIESLVHFLLIAEGFHKTIDWELVDIAPGNQKNMDGEVRKIDSHIYGKLSSPRPEKMTFDAMLKKAENKCLLGNNHSVYSKLKILRILRNRIHLQEIGNPTDTDWNAVNETDFYEMRAVIYTIFTGSIFKPSHEEKKFFEYLKTNA
ncbi:hypothetical protein [Candidatus Nitrospira allomarina]|uniref:Uncharacterized protein n=1 Tax=Candidatus Nitrospira allomarina TaxID=3020900 RepID=A0AA96GAT2_9BACT|nr:hypothetical protein [Candidatus Nitrospira allomarina]WNM58358.1 hypothetical protein PP769_00940 [Candidatus Nitrospira allomarina]